MTNARIRYFLFFVLFLILAVGVYHSGLFIPYFADDFQLVFPNPQDAIFHDFFKANPINLFYRPIQTMFLGIIQSIWGLETFPIRLINLLFHSATAFLVYYALRYWKISERASIAAAIFLIVSQTSAAAVVSNDTMSQVMGTFFSALALWLIYLYNTTSKKKLVYWWSIASFFLAVISKETSAGLVMAVPFLLYVLQKGSTAERIKQMVIKSLPYAASFLIYMGLRMNAAALNPTSGSGTYNFTFGMNIPKNIGLFLFQSLLPISSVEVVKDLHYQDYPALIAIGIFTVLFAAVLLYGLWKSPYKGVIGTVIVLGVCSWFPALPMALVGELYVGNTVPYMAVLVGLAAEYYFVTVKSKRVVAAMASVVIAAAIITNALATDEKAIAMKELGDRAAILLPKAAEAATTIPPNAFLYLVNPPDTSFNYSMYALRGFRVVTCADTVIRWLANRNDIHVFAADSIECVALAKQYPGIGFSYDTVTMNLYKMDADFGMQ